MFIFILEAFNDYSKHIVKFTNRILYDEGATPVIFLIFFRLINIEDGFLPGDF
jgi:hypothetical protein